MSHLTKKHKIAAGVLAVFGMFVIVMWVRQFRQNINAPFSFYKESANQQNTDTSCTGSGCGGNNEEDLRFTDSDKDGLFDWDELNIYGTSPYLEDSDSDGFNDKDEIDKGADPNCPEGKDCYETDKEPLKAEESDSNKDAMNQNDDLLNNLINQNSSDPATNQALELQNILSGQLNSASDLRRILIEFGMDKETLDKISDEDLLESYKETIKTTE
ncbi:MAG: hypothetical protein ABH888_01190 [Patescibacteria group bacterium]